MSVRLLSGDFRDHIADIPTGSIDCIFADPPYGETNIPWDKWPVGWPEVVKDVLKPTGSMWVFGTFRMFMRHRDEFAAWKIVQDIIWEKHNGSSFHNDRFRRVHEHAVQFYLKSAPWDGVYKQPQYTHDAKARTVRLKGRPAHWHGERGETVYRSEDGGPRLQRSVIHCRSMHGRAVHPTQKPEGAIEPLLRYACPEGGTVLDPFAGSGTTGIVAARLGMNAILFEANPVHFQAMRARFSEDLLSRGLV